MELEPDIAVESIDRRGVPLIQDAQITMARNLVIVGYALGLTFVVGLPTNVLATVDGATMTVAASASTAPQSIDSLLHRIAQLRNRGAYNEAIPLAELILDRLSVEENDSLYAIDDARRLLITLTRIASLSETEQCELSRVDATSSDTFDTAEPYYHEIEVRSRLLGKTQVDTLTSLTRLATWTLEHGQVCDGELLYREALDGFRKTLGEDHPKTVWTKTRLAIVMHYQGDYAEAVQLFRQVVVSRRRVQGKNNPDTRGAEVNLARMLYELGHYKESQALYAELFRWFNNRYGEENSITLNCMGSLACAMRANGKLDDAERLLRRRLAIDHELDANEMLDIDALHALAIVLLKKGGLSEAEQVLRQALAIHKRIIHVQDQKLINLLNCLAEVLYAQGRYDKAEATWKRSAKSFEIVRGQISYSGFDRIRFSADASPFLRLSACLARKGKPTEAWHYLERGLARSLIDVVEVASHHPRQSLTPEEMATRKKLESALSESDERVAIAQRNRPDVLTAARVEHNRRRADVIAFDKSMAVKYGIPESQPYKLEQVQRAIDPDEALVAWIDFPADAGAIDTSGDHWACVVRREGAPEWIRLPGTGHDGAWTDDDTTLAQRVADRIAEIPTARLPLANDIRALQLQRIRPIVPRLKDAKRLVILPVGPMGRVPVQALTSRYTIGYSPSATVFAWLEALEHRTTTGVPRRSLLALGDPAYRSSSSNGLPALPGTGYEVRSIAHMFDSTSTTRNTSGPQAESADRQAATLLLGKDATEENLQRLADDGELGRYAYIHLSAHGVLDDLAPWQSALLLSPTREATGASQQLRQRGRTYDDRLTAEQIACTWHLNAELVTLSGCETGLGKAEGGEGFVGFSQALFASGARSLVLSLWKVDDQATALLMSRFYENLTGSFTRERLVLGKSYAAGTRIPKSVALFEAKQWLRSNSPEENRAALRSLGFDVDQRTEAIAFARGAIRMTGEQAHEAFDYSDPHYWAAFVFSGDPG